MLLEANASALNLTAIVLEANHDEVQLRTMVKDRSSISETQAQCDVQEWMQDKQF